MLNLYLEEGGGGYVLYVAQLQRLSHADVGLHKTYIGMLSRVGRTWTHAAQPTTTTISLPYEYQSRLVIKSHQTAQRTSCIHTMEVSKLT